MTPKRCAERVFIGQKLFIMAAVLLILPAFFSCASGGGDPLSYRLAPFSAEIRGRISPRMGATVEFSALLELSPPSAGGRERVFSLTFKAPESLSGLTVRRDGDGEITLSTALGGGTVLAPETAKNYIKIAGMLAPTEDVVGISSIPGAQVGLSGYERLTLVELRSLVIAVDPATSRPVRAESRDGEIVYEVIAFRTR